MVSYSPYLLQKIYFEVNR